jgi:hypothetical protein
MELDIHLKTGDCSVLFSFEKPKKLWSYSVQRTQDWNLDYVLIEKVIRDFSFLYFNVSVITSYTTSKKWTDEYVTSLDKINNGLQQNEDRILSHIDKTDSVINDPSKRLKIISGGKMFVEKAGETVVPPVTLIKEHLAKDTELEATCEQVIKTAATKSKKAKSKSNKTITKKKS